MTRSATPRHGLEVDTDFAQFIEAQVLPGTGVTADAFWQGYAGLLDGFAAENVALLERRTSCSARSTVAQGSRKPALGRRRLSRLPDRDRLSWSPNQPRLPSRTATSTPRSPPWPGRSWSCRSAMPALP